MNSDKQFQPKTFKDKRKHLIDDLHEYETVDDLHDFFGLGKASKE